MTDTLQARIERLRELDRKRTPGDWQLTGGYWDAMPYTWAVQAQDRIPCISPNNTSSLFADGEFVQAAANDAVAIINELTARLEAIQGTLNPIRDLDWHGKWRVKAAIVLADLAKPFNRPEWANQMGR